MTGIYIRVMHAFVMASTDLPSFALGEHAVSLTVLCAAERSNHSKKRQGLFQGRSKSMRPEERDLL